MTDTWTQTMDPNAWICLHCGVRRIDGDFPDYVCKRAWNGVCEPRVLTPLDPEYEGPYKVKARRLKPVGEGEVVVSRTDLEWAVGMIEDEWTGTRGMLLHPDHDPIYARLRGAVLNTENQT